MGATILMSDDEPLLLSAFTRMGKRHGLNVVGVLHAEDVVATAVELKPDLILLDIKQSIDGRDLLAMLKLNPATCETPVMIVSGYGDQYLRHTCFELGAVEYEVKPFDISIVLKVLHLTERRENAA